MRIRIKGGDHLRESTVQFLSLSANITKKNKMYFVYFAVTLFIGSTLALQDACSTDYEALLNILSQLGQLPDNSQPQCEQILTDGLINSGNCYTVDIYKSYGYPSAADIPKLCGCLSKLIARKSEAETILASNECRPQNTDADACGTGNCKLVCINIFIFNSSYQHNIIFRFYISISAPNLHASTAPFSWNVTIPLSLQLLHWIVLLQAPECLTQRPHKGQTII